MVDFIKYSKIICLMTDEEWIEKGVDIWLIRDNLKLSFEERVEQHQNTLDFVDELKQMISSHDSKPSRPPETTPPKRS